MSYLVFILTGVIISLGFIGNCLFKRKGIPDNLILILFGLLLGPIFHLVEPSSFAGIAPIFSSIALLIILLDGGMNLNLFKVLGESPKAMVLGTLNVVFSMVLTALFTVTFLEWDLIYGLMLGAMIGGTSSSIVISLVRKLDVSDGIVTLLSLESVFTDALVIVVSVTFLDILGSARVMNLNEMTQSITSTLSIGVVFGLVLGVLWLKMLSKLRDSVYDDILTLSVAIIFYGLTETVGGNGAIFSLVFGLVLGNSVEIGGMLHMQERVEVGNIMRKFMSQMSFFIRTYFFVYLGLILFIENYSTIIYSALIMVLLIVGRFISVALTSIGDAELKGQREVLVAMMPRGIAAAVMAQLAISSGVQYAYMMPDLILIIIILTVALSSVWSSVLERKKMRDDSAKEAVEEKLEGAAGLAPVLTPEADEDHPAQP